MPLFMTVSIQKHISLHFDNPSIHDSFYFELISLLCIEGLDSELDQPQLG